jgi:predicted nucleic acid-binding Zn ribbon protein
MKTKKDKAKFVHISSVIDEVLKTYRREPDGELLRVWHIWDSIVGEIISKNAKPAAFKGRILVVYVTSSTWVHQLQFLKAEMIAKLNEALGKSLIDDLKFKIGPV